MAWRMSVVRDISHHQGTLNYGAFKQYASDVQIKITESTTFIDNMAQVYFNNLAGMRRAPYHFARPVSFSAQIAHFLRRKAQIGQWERPDMLDCEFSGITGEFIRLLVAEYRKQSGIQQVQVYVGLHDILTSCPPSQWWDEDIYIQVARYRKIGGPENPDAWRTHLGFDHPGLATYQWDNAQPFYPGGPVGDISYDRIFVRSSMGGNEMEPTTRMTVPSPGNRAYTETNEARFFWGDTYFFTADMAKIHIPAIKAMLVQLIAAHADGEHDIEAILQRMEEGQRQAIYDAISTLAVPALTAIFQKFITDGDVDEEIANAVVRAFAVRLDTPEALSPSEIESP